MYTAHGGLHSNNIDLRLTGLCCQTDRLFGFYLPLPVVTAAWERNKLIPIFLKQPQGIAITF